PFEPTEVLFDNSGVTGIRLRNNDSGKSEDLMVDGIFMAIGHKPNSETFLPYVDLDGHGYIKVKNYTQTKTPGVFSAGDIADPVFKQAITAAGMGCQAAMQAAKFIETLEE